MANVFEAYRNIQKRRRNALKESYDGIAGIMMEIIPDFYLHDMDIYFPDGKIDIVFNEETGDIFIDNTDCIELGDYYTEEMEKYALSIEEHFPGIKLEGKITIYLREEKIAIWMTKNIFEGYIEEEYETSQEAFLDDFEKLYKNGRVYILDNNDAELYIKADSFVTVVPRSNFSS